MRVSKKIRNTKNHKNGGILMKFEVKDIELEEGLQREWIITNGIGGYASSTIIGANTTIRSNITKKFLICSISFVERVIKLDAPNSLNSAVE